MTTTVDVGPSDSARAGSPGIVALALDDGWHAVKRRWPLLLGGQLLLLLHGSATILATYMALGRSATHVLDSGWADGIANLHPTWSVVSLALTLGGVLLLVGYCAAALRTVREEQIGLRRLFEAFRRLPDALGTGLIVLLVWAAGPAAFGAAIWVLATLGSLLVTAGATGGSTSLAVVVVALSLLSALVLAAIAAAWSYVATGVSLSPLLAMDARLSWREAVHSSWTLMRGRRLAMLSLWLASLALLMLGHLALYVGVFLGVAIAAAAYAAFYARLRSGEEDRFDIADRRVLTSWVIDGFLAEALMWSTLLVVLIAGVAPIVEAVKADGPPFGTLLLLTPITLPAPIALALYVLFSLWRGRPGRRVVGQGWGRFRWLAVAFVLGLISTVGTVIRVFPETHRGLTALAIGREMTRIVTSVLPAGYVRDDLVTESNWFDAMSAEGQGGGENEVSARYAISDTMSVSYEFRLSRYFTTAVAQEAFDRLRGPDGLPIADLGHEAARADDAAAGVARVVVLHGDTVLAGQADVDQAAELERLVRIQAERLEAARVQTEPVYAGLRKPAQRLAPWPVPAP